MSRPVTATARCPSPRPAASVRREPGGAGVSIELSAAQVYKVVRAASDGGSMSVLLSRLAPVRAVLAARPQPESSRLSRSLLCGLLVLASFPTDGSYRAIADIARMTGRSPSTAHRYVHTLISAGLLEQDPHTREYRLAR
jgi:hypothetical protein